MTDTIRRTAHWLHAVQLQLDRIDQVVSEHRSAPMEPASVMERILRLELDEYFFLAALRKVDRWLDRACLVDSALVVPTQTFRAALRYLPEIRNMWEHDDDYLHGEGDQQADYVRDEVIKGLPQSAGSSMMWTHPDVGYRHIIGNRFELDKARTAILSVAMDVRAALARTPPMSVVSGEVHLPPGPPGDETEVREGHLQPSHGRGTDEPY